MFNEYSFQYEQETPTCSSDRALPRPGDSDYGFHKRWEWGLQVLMACSPAHLLSRDPSCSAASRAQRLRAHCAGGQAQLNISLARVPAIRWRTPIPGSLDQRLAPAPSVDPDSIGIFAPCLRLALRCGQLTAAGRHPYRPRAAKSILVERMSAFPRTIAILWPDSWHTVARENGSLAGRY
jgi:hypothetical protein